jgi:hypothetical protein
VVRSELTSQGLEALCWRDDSLLAVAAEAVLLAGEMPAAA